MTLLSDPVVVETIGSTTAQWLIGLLGGCIVASGTALAFMLRISFKLGESSREITSTAVKIAEVGSKLASTETRLAEVAVITKRVEHLEEDMREIQGELKILQRGSRP